MVFERSYNRQLAKCRRNWKGFTLVELMVAMSISVMFFGVAGSSMILFAKIERTVSAMNDIEQQKSNFRKWFSRDMREAKIYRISSAQSVSLKLIDETLITYKIDPSDSTSLLRSINNGAGMAVVRDLNTVNFSYNDAGQEEVLVAMSLRRSVRSDKYIESSISSIFRRRN